MRSPSRSLGTYAHGMPDQAGRRARRTAGLPWAGPAFVALSVVLAVCALVFQTARAAFVVQSAVWLVVGVTVMLARRRRPGSRPPSH